MHRSLQRLIDATGVEILRCLDCGFYWTMKVPAMQRELAEAVKQAGECADCASRRIIRGLE